MKNDEKYFDKCKVPIIDACRELRNFNWDKLWNHVDELEKSKCYNIGDTETMKSILTDITNSHDPVVIREKMDIFYWRLLRGLLD